MGRPRAAVVIAVVGAMAFGVLCVLVATNATQQLDVAARDYFRPHDEWGPTQMRVDVVVEGLKPRNVAVLLAVIGVIASLRESSWRPALQVAQIAFVAGALTLLAKVTLQRPDPHHEMTAVGGSFPSGHTMGVLLCVGVALLVLRECPRWWEWGISMLAGVAMGLALLVQAAHWFTDVVGGVLVALTVLAVASLSPLMRPHRQARSSRCGDRDEAPHP